MDGGLSDRLEIEDKFEVGPDFVLPDLAGLADGLGVGVTAPVVHQLVASYFDTSDQRLAAAGIALRRRTGGKDAGWHLKLPVAKGARRELQAPLGRGNEAVPASLASLVSEWTQGQPLRVIATLETRRTVRHVTSATGEDLAEVADDTVLGRLPGQDGTEGTSLTWREIEVELMAGPPEILRAAGARLRAAGARPSASVSKISRLLNAGAAPPPPDR